MLATLFCYCRMESWYLRFSSDKMLHFIHPNFSCRKMPDQLEVETVQGPKPKNIIWTLRGYETNSLPCFLAPLRN